MYSHKVCKICKLTKCLEQSKYIVNMLECIKIEVQNIIGSLIIEPTSVQFLNNMQRMSYNYTYPQINSHEDFKHPIDVSNAEHHNAVQRKDHHHDNHGATVSGDAVVLILATRIVIKDLTTQDSRSQKVIRILFTYISTLVWIHIF